MLVLLCITGEGFTGLSVTPWSAEELKAAESLADEIASRRKELQVSISDITLRVSGKKRYVES